MRKKLKPKKYRCENCKTVVKEIEKYVNRKRVCSYWYEILSKKLKEKYKS